jgi:RNA polymerase sigma-70 factor (ECF subfamily)
MALDKAVFEQLFREEINRLHRFAMQYVKDGDSAMDICQGVFITLWEKREGIDMNRSVRSYLYTSVKNRCLNYIRDQKKYRSKILDLDYADVDTIGTSEDNPGQEDLERLVSEALDSLPEKCRQVFEMSRISGLKYREIAEELEISQKTVEAHMSKAMRILRDALSGYHLFFWLVLYFLLFGNQGKVEFMCIL